MLRAIFGFIAQPIAIKHTVSYTYCQRTRFVFGVEFEKTENMWEESAIFFQFICVFQASNSLIVMVFVTSFNTFEKNKTFVTYKYHNLAQFIWNNCLLAVKFDSTYVSNNLNYFLEQSCVELK